MKEGEELYIWDSPDTVDATQADSFTPYINKRRADDADVLLPTIFATIKKNGMHKLAAIKFNNRPKRPRTKVNLQYYVRDIPNTRFGKAASTQEALKTIHSVGTGS